MKSRRTPETRGNKKQARKPKESREKRALKIKSSIKAGPYIAND